jgi:DNA helicase-2/ATP-dependent DNA helicase PcrA
VSAPEAVPPQQKFALNAEQHQAVHHTKGPLLVVAGAGSGKTRVIVEKINHLVDEGMKPFTILALTFTNKAAITMRERLVEYGIEGPWVCTFHSMCVRILKKEAQHLGLSEQFSIFDTDDQSSVAKSILKDMELDSAIYKPSQVLGEVSQFKNKGLSAEEAKRDSEGDMAATIYAKFYERYEKALTTNQALDFDDLMLKTLQLFKEHPKVLENYQKKFNYILVDEYQDTNSIQYQIIRFLEPGSQGFTLTGDPDQSIYSWRGADIHNILNFLKDFPDGTIIKMEQNYRSQKHILELANQLVRHNTERYEKDAITQNPDGPLPILHCVYSAQDEANLLAKLIIAKKDKGHKLSDVAVFYRTNQQSRSLEESLRKHNLPYVLIGGTKFFERKEIKDLIAYLRFIHNPADSISLMRIINLPTRGIGENLKGKVRDFADDNGLNCWQALMNANFPNTLDKRAKTAILKFNQLVANFFELSYAKPDLLLKRILDETKFLESLTIKGEVEEDRVDNVQEFMAYVSEYSDKNNNANLSTLLEDIALIGDNKKPGEEDPAATDMITLMTLHASKGLEYPFVFFAGLDEGLLPHQRSIDQGGLTDIEEERRLCYVGITRAESELHLFTARERHTFKGPAPFKVSRFVGEMQGHHLAISKNGQLLTPREWNEPIGSVFKRTQSARPLRKGSMVTHARFGKGVVMDLSGSGIHQKAKVFFNKVGEKIVLLEFDVLEVM